MTGALDGTSGRRPQAGHGVIFSSEELHGLKEAKKAKGWDAQETVGVPLKCP